MVGKALGLKGRKGRKGHKGRKVGIGSDFGAVVIEAVSKKSFRRLP